MEQSVSGSRWRPRCAWPRRRDTSSGSCAAPGNDSSRDRYRRFLPRGRKGACRVSARQPQKRPSHSLWTVEGTALTLLALACRDSERLRFGYTDREGQVSERHVEPHRLVNTGRRWYLVARDVDRAGWRSFRLDRLHDPQSTGRRSPPADPPDAARFVSEGVSTHQYRWQARVVLEAPADLVPATVGVVEAVETERCLLVAGADSLDAIALHLALLDIPFTPLQPPQLEERCAVLAERLSHAATPTKT